jgi:hypothetical protein
MNNPFNQVVDEYSNGREGYPIELYNLIQTYASFTAESSLLEIGGGTGLASKEIADFWNARLSILEPAPNLYKFSCNRFKDDKKIELHNCSFEDYNTSERYNGILSATAFHWLDKSVKYKKAHELLNTNGFLILYWNNYMMDDPAIQEIHKLYHPNGDYNLKLAIRNKIDTRRDEVAESGYFKLLGHHELTHPVVYDTNRYLNLLHSFSTSSDYGNDRMQVFYEHIADYLHSVGDQITMKMIANLEVAQKLSMID